MNNIIAPDLTEVNLNTAVIVIRAFDKRGQWQVEATFEGGVTVTGPATADEVNELESKLTDWGWRVNPSLYNGGFNARPVLVEDWEMPFASGRMWVDDYAIEPAL